MLTSVLFPASPIDRFARRSAEEWAALARQHGVEVDAEENAVLVAVLRVLGRGGRVLALPRCVLVLVVFSVLCPSSSSSFQKF